MSDKSATKPLPSFIEERLNFYIRDLITQNESKKHLVLGKRPQQKSVVMQSNDYLALSHNTQIQKAHQSAICEHDDNVVMSAIFLQDEQSKPAFETELASYVGMESCLLSQSGWAANIGLLQMVSLPFWVELLIAVMALDFIAQYVVHYILHRVKWMWKFHMVHHSDTKVDATTGTRHHPGDYLIREIFAIATVIIFGIPVSFYVFYRICTIFFTYFSHANISLPAGVDKVLSFVFITPNVHKFHHHFERPWTDTNFGNIFSLWDRMCGTFVYDDPRKIKYGLDVADETKDENIRYQLGLPMNKSIKTDY